MKKIIILYLSILCIFGCGKDDAQKVESLIEHAQSQITQKNCKDAVETLTKNGVQKTNARYLRTLAQAYACVANFSALVFTVEDIMMLEFETSGFNGLATFSNTRGLKSTDNLSSEKMVYMQKAIDTLLYVGTLKPGDDISPEKRAAFFSQKDLNLINQMLAYLSVAQFANYLKIFGNADDDGLKGEGSGANKCFSNYNLLPYNIQNQVEASTTGACESVSGYSHPELVISSNTLATALPIKNLCYGLVTFNQMITYITMFLDELDLEILNESIDAINNYKEQVKQDLGPLIGSWSNFDEIYDVKSCIEHNDYSPAVFQLLSLYILEKNFK